MKTKSLTLFYEITADGINPPNITEIERKERWIKELQKEVEVDYRPLFVKQKYEIFNPQISRQLKFFNGTVVMYYCIQNEEMISGLPTNKTLKEYREMLLDEMLGYDFKAIDRTIRKRKSTTDFKTIQAWNRFLETVKETLFDPAGYEFPDSEEYWELVDQVGEEEAKRKSIERLQTKLMGKLKFNGQEN